MEIRKGCCVCNSPFFLSLPRRVEAAGRRRSRILSAARGTERRGERYASRRGESTMKIAIIGYSGSGKSTLARHLGRQYGLDVLYLDKVYWLPGWRERPKAETQGMVEAFLDTHSAWVIDGNYTSFSFERRMAEADRILFFEFQPLPLPEPGCGAPQSLSGQEQALHHRRMSGKDGLGILLVDPLSGPNRPAKGGFPQPVGPLSRQSDGNQEPACAGPRLPGGGAGGCAAGTGGAGDPLTGPGAGRVSPRRRRPGHCPAGAGRRSSQAARHCRMPTSPASRSFARRVSPSSNRTKWAVPPGWK